PRGCDRPDEPRCIRQLELNGRQRAIWPARCCEPDAQPADHAATEVLTMRRLAVLALVLVAAAAGAQQVGQNRDANAPRDYTLSMNGRLVVENVVAKDK